MFSLTRPALSHLSEWPRALRRKSPPRLILDNNIVARDATVSELGIALLPRFLAAKFVRDGQLVEVLRGWSGPPLPLRADLPLRPLFGPQR